MILFRIPGDAHLQHHGAVECNSVGKAVHRVVELAAEATLLVYITSQLPGSGAVGRMLQPMQVLLHCTCHLLSQPSLDSTAEHTAQGALSTKHWHMHADTGGRRCQEPSPGLWTQKCN